MTITSENDDFAGAREAFEELLGFLAGDQALSASHGELEDALGERGRELLRQLYQDHLDLRARREVRLEEVTDAKGIVRRYAEEGHQRSLATVFGEVVVERLAYRRRGEQNLHLADAVLNLPEEKHSHGLRRLVAIEASRGSFEEAQGAISRATGQGLGKRQVESLACRAAADEEAFYDTRRPGPAEDEDVLVVSCDGKGIVMRPEALREPTRKMAQAANRKLKTRLSKGEPHGRKRMATVGAVYDVTPVPRTAEDVMAPSAESSAPAPQAKGKWLTASVVCDAEAVVRRVFDEAERRDPDYCRRWVVLVDGNNHQIDRIEEEARRRGVEVSIVVDFVHVLEYLWKAAWSFFSEGDPAAEAWVRDRALAVLDGHATDVAAGVRRRASTERLRGTPRQRAHTSADYLSNKAAYLDYPTALSSGWPISTGVIEGACRHLCKDRMDVTGARWGLEGAEAILKLRVLRANGDFEPYWRFHVSLEHERVHKSRYAEGVIPLAA